MIEVKNVTKVYRRGKTELCDLEAGSPHHLGQPLLGRLRQTQLAGAAGGQA